MSLGTYTVRKFGPHSLTKGLRAPRTRPKAVHSPPSRPVRRPRQAAHPASRRGPPGRPPKGPSGHALKPSRRPAAACPAPPPAHPRAGRSAPPCAPPYGCYSPGPLWSRALPVAGGLALGGRCARLCCPLGSNGSWERFRRSPRHRGAAVFENSTACAPRWPPCHRCASRFVMPAPLNPARARQRGIKKYQQY
jgi:hypothetical protein